MLHVHYHIIRNFNPVQFAQYFKYIVTINYVKLQSHVIGANSDYCQDLMN